MENSLLKKRIMRRVYAIWLVRRARPVVFLQLPLVLLFLVIEHEYVAFRAVASNTLTSFDSPSSMFHYLVAAFANTGPLEAFLASAIGLFTLLAVTSVIRNIVTVYSKKTIALPLKVDKSQ